MWLTSRTGIICPLLLEVDVTTVGFGVGGGLKMTLLLDTLLLGLVDSLRLTLPPPFESSMWLWFAFVEVSFDELCTSCSDGEGLKEGAGEIGWLLIVFPVGFAAGIICDRWLSWPVFCWEWTGPLLGGLWNDGCKLPLLGSKVICPWGVRDWGGYTIGGGGACAGCVSVAVMWLCWFVCCWW